MVTTLQQRLDRIWQHIMRLRDKAPNCEICNKKLFDGMCKLDEYFYEEHRDHKFTQSELKAIYNYFWEHYPYMKEGNLSRHHINYKDNIQIAVCRKCHRKIHSNKYPELKKYYPIDKRDKKNKYFKSNIVKPLHLE